MIPKNAYLNEISIIYYYNELENNCKAWLTTCDCIQLILLFILLLALWDTPSHLVKWTGKHMITTLCHIKTTFNVY